MAKIISEAEFYNRSHGQRIIEGLENGSFIFGRNSCPVFKLCIENSPEECSEANILDMFILKEDGDTWWQEYTAKVKAPSNLFLRASNII